MPDNEKKTLELQLADLEKVIATFIQKADGEIALTGKMSAETKTALEAEAARGKEMQDRLMAIEQKLVRPVGDGAIVLSKSLGEQFIESEQFKNLGRGQRSSGKLLVGDLYQKTALINAIGQNQPLVPPMYVPGITTPAMQPLRVRNLFPNLPTSSNMIYYVRELSFTNNAGVQGAGSSPQVYENYPKPESGLTFELLYQPVQTIGHWIPVSRQILEDSPALRGYIDSRLLYGLRLKEETELLTGTGVGASIKGLITSATAYDTARNQAGDTKIDTVSHAGTQVQGSYYLWEFTILHPDDWEKILLVKTTGTASSGQYIFGDPHTVTGPTLWGRPVVTSFSMPANHFLAGSYMAATIWDRRDATIEISLEHSDFFIRNMAAILCEERLGMTVQVPAALVYGAFVS